MNKKYKLLFVRIYFKFSFQPDVELVTFSHRLLSANSHEDLYNEVSRLHAHPAEFFLVIYQIGHIFFYFLHIHWKSTKDNEFSMLFLCSYLIQGKVKVVESLVE